MKLFATLFASLGGGLSQAAIAALVALAIFGGGYLKGSTSVRAELASDTAKEKLDIALAYAVEIVAQQGIADNLTAENTVLRSAQAPRDRIITKEITRYVQVTPPAARCTLPGTFRLLHDAAASGLPPAAEAGPLVDASANPVDDAAALETIGANYNACRESIAKVEGWQRRQRALESGNEKTN